MLLSNAKIVLPGEIREGALAVRNGRVEKMGRFPSSNTKTALDLRGGYLAPGFIDLHVHGAVGHDTMEATSEAFRAITEFHLRGGTTSMTLTTLTAAEADILRVLQRVKPLLNQSIGGARIVGVHVEGPFISRAKAGAQDPRFIRPAEPVEWREYLRFGKLITAPI